MFYKIIRANVHVCVLSTLFNLSICPLGICIQQAAALESPGPDSVLASIGNEQTFSLVRQDWDNPPMLQDENSSQNASFQAKM